MIYIRIFAAYYYYIKRLRHWMAFCVLMCR